MTHAHTLVVGGTGMLSGATAALSEISLCTSVIARSAHSLDRLGQSLRGASARYNPIAVDYHRTDLLEKIILGAIADYGPIDLVVSWIHSDAPQAPLVIARLTAARAEKVQYFHIYGSSGGDPSRKPSVLEKEMLAMPNLAFHRVVLGFVIEGRGSRWLTNQEISQGVIDAI